MMNGNDIKKIAKNILHHEKELHDSQIMHPVRDWYIGVLVAVLIVLATAVWSTQTYFSNRNAVGEVIASEAIQATVYRQNAVQEALQIFADRQTYSEALVNSQPDLRPLPEEEIASSTVEQASTTEEVVEEEIEVEQATSTEN